jgi:predicted RNA methylase
VLRDLNNRDKPKESFPSIKDKLRNLILRSLSVDYVSESCQDSIQTGNHYQSVSLDGIQTTGFRTDRTPFLDQIDFRDKKILDLGSNLGELSRAARARGAYLVDGFEYDPYFLEIANMVNAHNTATRVSFYQRDITNPAVYNEHYDIVLAFSVFIYVRPVLDRIAEITNQVFVLETHKLEGNLESTYLQPIARYFPYYKVLGESEWGTVHDARDRRMVIAFAKEESALATVLKERVPDPRSAIERTMHGESTRRLSGDTPTRYIDVSKTWWYDNFFSTLEFSLTEDLLAMVANMEIDARTIARCHDLSKNGIAGWIYWLLYVKGYTQYMSTGALDSGNVYYDYLTQHIDPQAQDPGLVTELATPSSAAERVTRRFRDLDFFRNRVAQDPSEANNIDPIIIIVRDPPPNTAKWVYEVGTETPLQASMIDGFHRIFAARLFGAERLPCEVINEESELGHIRGVVEHFRFDGQRLIIHGWCLNPNHVFDCVEVRHEQQSLAWAEVTDRPDVQQHYGHIRHAERSGFVIAFPCSYLPTDQFLHFQVVPSSGWQAIGTMDVFYLPWMFDEHNYRPPAPLAQRLLNESDPTKLAFMSVKRMYEMLMPIKRYRSLYSFTSVLDWGSRCGLLEVFRLHFLPETTLVGIDVDEEAIEWCNRSGPPGEFMVVDRMPPTDLASDYFDLVLSYSALTHLTYDAQSAWLGEMHRVMKSGGYLAAGVYGELVRPFLKAPEILSELTSGGISDSSHNSRSDSMDRAGHGRATYQTKAFTVREYSKRFEIVEYIEGGLNDLLDLVIMRKA